MGSWSQSCGPSNTWECLSVWRDEQTPQSAWGFEHFDGVDAQLFDDEHCTHANLMYGAHQGLQPYVNVWDYHDTPFTHELMGNFNIDMGKGQDFTGLFLPRAGMSQQAVKKVVNELPLQASHQGRRRLVQGMSMTTM